MNRRIRFSLFLLLLTFIAAPALLLASRVKGLRDEWRTVPTTQQAAVSRDRLWMADALFSSAGMGIAGRNLWYTVSSQSGYIEVGTLESRLRIPLVHLSDKVTSTPLLYEGMLLVPTLGSGVVAVDVQTGARLWSTQTGGWINSIAQAGDSLIVGQSQSVCAMDIDDGKLRWTKPAGGVMATDVAATSSYVCFGVNDQLCVLDRKTGELQRQIKLERAPAGHIAVDGDDVFVCSAPVQGVNQLPLYRVNLRSGQIKWRYSPNDLTLILGEEQIRGPCAGDGLICFAFGERLYAVDVKNGEPRWRFRALPGSETDWRHISIREPLVGAPCFHHGLVFVSNLDRISALDPASGRELWRYEAGPGNAPGPVSTIPPTVRGNVVSAPLGPATFHAVQLKADKLAEGLSAGAKRVSSHYAYGALISASLFVLLFRRRWRAIFAFVCLALCGAVLWAWGTSYTTSQFFGQMQRTATKTHEAMQTAGFASRDGGLTFCASRAVWQSGLAQLPIGGETESAIWWTKQPHAEDPQSLRDPPAKLGMLHFGATHRSHPSGTPLGDQYETSLTLPHWFVVALLAIAPLMWLTGLWRDRRRYPKGHCVKCGYDLRASGEVCPECGQVVKRN